MGGVGNFQVERIFFSLLACAGIFFFTGETLCTNFFFQTNIAFILNSEILIHYLCFCALQIIILCTHDRLKDISHFLTQNLLQNVHAVREEEATWCGRLPCALLQSLVSSGIPLPQPIIMIPFAINQNSPSVIPSTLKRHCIIEFLFKGIL